jgi:branched-chain amino acid transport system permease protein
MSSFLLYLIASLPLVGAYMLLGMGITVIYQASRVLNLAHGVLAMAGAYAMYQLTRWSVPLPVSVVGGLLAGGALALVVERVLVRRLRPAGPTTQTVGTVAALTLGIALATRVWGSLPVQTPSLFPQTTIHIGGGFVALPLVAIFPIGVIGAALLFGLFRYTDIGLAMRGAAQNRRGAALRGVNPDQTAALAWFIGGVFAALIGILLASATALDPFNIALGVLPAFVAALIGGLESMPGVCIGAAIIGITQGLVPWIGVLQPRVGSVVQGQGAPQLVLGVLALAVMATRGARLVAGDVRGDTL